MFQVRINRRTIFSFKNTYWHILIKHPVYIKSNRRTYLVKYNLKINEKISDSETASIAFHESGQQVICPASRKPSCACFLLPCVVVRVWTSFGEGLWWQLGLLLSRRHRGGLLLLGSGRARAQSQVLFCLFCFLRLLRSAGVQIKDQKIQSLWLISRVQVEANAVMAVTVVYGAIQQRSLFAKECGKWGLNEGVLGEGRVALGWWRNHENGFQPSCDIRWQNTDKNKCVKEKLGRASSGWSTINSESFVWCSYFFQKNFFLMFELHLHSENDCTCIESRNGVNTRDCPKFED